MTPKLWFHPAFLFLFAAIFLPLGDRKKKKKIKKKGGVRGWVRTHACNRLKKKRFQIRHILRKKNLKSPNLKFKFLN
jgi:hypothetical protein